MTPLTQTDRDSLLLEIIERIENDTQVIGDPSRAAVWERGWQEALAKFRANPCEESLVPAFIHHDKPCRYQGNLYHQDDDFNELRWARQMQCDIAEYLEGCDHIAEFGCGTGWNLVALAQRFPKKDFIGVDSASSAVELVKCVAENFNLNIKCNSADMADIDRWKRVSKLLHENSGIFTFGSVEQLAQNWQPFFEYLIANKPQIVVHVEPVLELYDPRNLLDALAIRFHVKRGYAHGWLPWLQNDPRVEMIHVERSSFGSLMHEGYSMVVWKPL